MQKYVRTFVALMALAVLALASLARAQQATPYDTPALAAAAARVAADIRARVLPRGAQPQAATAQQSLALAKQLVEQRKWAEALPHLERAIANGAADHQTWLNYAFAVAAQRNFARALEASYLAWKAAGDNAARALGLYYVGFYYEMLRKPDEAIAAYEDSLKLARNTTAQQRLKTLLEQYRHQVVETKAEVETDSPRICLTFSKMLPAGDPQALAPFIAVQPAIRAGLEARDKTLCIAGVAHGQTYRVTVRPGLPSAGEHKTTREAVLTVAVPDRERTVGFRGKAHVLPKTGRQAVPLVSVNLERAELRLLRITDRNLIAEINEGRLRQLLSGYDARKIEEQHGELVWSGSVAIDLVRNREVTTAIPVGDVLKATKAGIYVLMARPANKTYDRGDEWATQWLLVSDLGIGTYVGADGLGVFVRSYDSAEPKAGVVVRLVARNNEVLATATTDNTGRAQFAPGLLRGTGGGRAAAVMATTAEGDFAFLDLVRPAFDLTDRGVGGRPTPGPVDAYVFAERGVYRPGETVHLTALVRDANAQALDGQPLVIRFIRPDGVEAMRHTVRPTATAGGYALSVPLSKATSTGRWRVEALIDPKGRAVGGTSIQVEDFVPERLEMTLKPDLPALEPGKTLRIALDGRFLYGASAANLVVEAEMILKQDMRPYPEFEGYTFGLVQESWEPKRVALPAAKTDAAGKATLSAAIDRAPETTRPLKAEFRVSLLEEGGRALERTVTVPVRAHDLVLGVRLKSDEPGLVAEGRNSEFEIIALDRAGKRIAKERLTFSLVREVIEGQWYYQDGAWKYRAVVREEPIRTANVAIPADRPAAVSILTGEGRYRFEVRDTATGAAASIRYHVGWAWGGDESEDVPDKLAVRLDKPAYKAGETAKVSIRAPFDGIAHIVVAGDRILDSRHVAVTKAGTVVDVGVDEAWGTGVYVVVTAYRPANRTEQRGPSRAIGLAYLAREGRDRALAVAIAAPETIRPRQKQTVTLTIEGARGEPAFVTVAAVDEGILSLTGYKTPSPEAHFFGKRMLGLELRDDYGRLIDAYAGKIGALRSGGDAAGRHLGGLDASSIKTVSLFSGIVAVDERGQATVTLDVPDFNGRLRLMAVAWTRGKVGQSERPMTVRDPVVTLVTLPRFLAPGDQGRVTVAIHNVDGAAGAYKVALAAAGGAATVAGAAAADVTLAKDQRATLPFVLAGNAPGVASLTLTLTGPDGTRLTRSWDIAVRPAQPATSRFVAVSIERGGTHTIGARELGEFLPGTGRIYLSAGSAPDLGLADLLASLDRYPYGCAEQTTSRALPLLYLSEVARSIGLGGDDAAIRATVQGAIQRVLAMQQRDGGFGLWSAQDEAEAWLTAYVMDFLTQARAKDYLVPDFAFSSGLARLEAMTRELPIEGRYLGALAYAHYVLAQNQRGDAAAVRYLADTQMKDVPTALAKAQIAATLALLGDMNRAGPALAAARAHDKRGDYEKNEEEGRRRSVSLYDYGSPLRDRAGVLHLASTAAPSADLGPLVAQVQAQRLAQRQLSTQEQAWLLLAAHGLSAKAGGYKASIGGRAVEGAGRPTTLRLDAAAIGPGLAIRNDGEGRLWIGASVVGIPARDLPAESRGFEIKRSYYTLDGKPADLARVRQSEVLVVLVRVTAKTDQYHQAMVVDLLPAGFEIENPRLERRKPEDMKWLPKELAEPRYIEPRDDRYVAAIEIGGKERDFYLAYVVRAVTPGSFKLPAAYVEDMYAPSIFGRDAMGRVTVLPRS
jgi:hypothetical protein